MLPSALAVAECTRGETRERLTLAIPRLPSELIYFLVLTAAVAALNVVETAEAARALDV